MGEEGAAEALANPQDTLRKRGRLRGYPKSGGRQKGTRNWSQPEIRAELLNQSDAIPTLAAIARGDKLFVSGPTGKAVWRHPTMKERLHALDLVFAKVVPDLKASEVSASQCRRCFEKPPRAVRRSKPLGLHLAAAGRNLIRLTCPRTSSRLRLQHRQHPRLSQSVRPSVNPSSASPKSSTMARPSLSSRRRAAETADGWCWTHTAHSTVTKPTNTPRLSTHCGSVPVPRGDTAAFRGKADMTFCGAHFRF
jgi:hypothetical protein